MRRAAIVAPVRTPAGLAGGALSRVAPGRMASIAIRAVLERARLHPSWVDDVAMAGAGPTFWAEDGTGSGMALPVFHPDRAYGNGLQAVLSAAMMVQTGVADVVVAGGVERAQPRNGQPTSRAEVENAEVLARRWGVTRADADEYAAVSHWRAARAWQRGSFDDELVPIDVGPLGDAEMGDAYGYLVDRDEGIRGDTTTDVLAELQPLIPRGVVTAGNMSCPNDVAAACLVVAEDRLDDLELAPMAYLTGWASAGCDSAESAFGPALSAAKLLNRLGLLLDDLDMVEIDEGFSVEVPAIMRAWEWDRDDLINVNGSAISLGHSAQATGLRIMTSMIHELHRSKGQFGMQTVSLGRNHGIAALFEVATPTSYPRTTTKPHRVGARFHGVETMSPPITRTQPKMEKKKARVGARFHGSTGTGG